MFEQKKIILNYLRANNVKNKKAQAFYDLVCEEIIERSNILKSPEGFFLELGARNNLLYKKFKFIKMEKNFYQTVTSPEIRLQNKNKFICKLEDNPFTNQLFNYCFNIFSLNSTKNIITAFRTVHDLLKIDGKFVCVMPAENCLAEFKEIFYETFPSLNSFTPIIKMEDLGKIGRATGFKNIVVDKTEFSLIVKKPQDIWYFIRNLGEANILNNRSKDFLKAQKYKYLCKKIEEEIIKNKSSITVSLNFFAGNK